MKEALIEYSPCYPGYTVQQVHEHIQRQLQKMRPHFYKKTNGTKVKVTINGKTVAVVELRR